MPRIVFLSSSLYNYFSSEIVKEYAGVSRIYRLVKNLSAAGYNICCFVENYGRPVTIHSMDVSFIQAPISKVYRAPEVFFRLLKQKPDLIVDFYASPRIFLLALLKRLRGIRYVFFVGSDTDVNGAYREIAGSLFHRLYTWGLAQADDIICQTSAQAATLKAVYGIKSHVVLSPYVEIVPPIDLNKEYVLWIGRSAYYKRPEYFLDIVESIPDEKFVMICNPSRYDKGGHRHLQRRAVKLPNLRFIEQVPFSQIRPYYARAKFIVNTSDFEGFPNTFIEAALERTPIVSLRVDPNGMFGRHKAGICCNGRKEKLLNVCRLLATGNEVTTQQMGRQAREYAVRYHGVQQAIKRIGAIFNEVLTDLPVK